MYYTNKNRNCLKEIKIQINNEILKEVDSAKYPGVMMDNKLNWNSQINNIKLRLSKGISILSLMRHYVPQTTLRSLYFTFINSHIDYNLLNWGTAPPSTLETVSSKTRKAIRIISFKEKEEPSLPLFIKHSILPLEQNLELKQANFMWKLDNDLIPPSLANNFRLNRNQINLAYNRLQTSNNHITYAGPRIWQKIPDNIKGKAFPKSFSKSYRSHLLDTLNS